MAKLEQGILGPFRGKVGTVVGYLWRGKQVVRAYRHEINYPNTERQQAEREWFVGMVRFAATARQALLLGLREQAAQWQMTEGNAFVRMNKSCFGRDAACRVRSASAEDMSRSAADMVACGSAADMVSYGLTADAARRVRTGVDYARIKIAEGVAAPVRFTTASMDENHVLCVDYEKNSGMTRAKASDKVYVYVYNIDTREGLLSHPAERRQGQLKMQLPEGWCMENVKLWGYVVDGAGRASASQFITMAERQERSETLENQSSENFNEITQGMRSHKTSIKYPPLTGQKTDAPSGAPA